MAKGQPEITKHLVTMSNPLPQQGADGQWIIFAREITVTDHVPNDVRGGVNVLDAYVADARKRWGTVTVSEEPDAGPGGYHGQTHIPATLDHPLAGQTFAATQED